jgi:activator of HSP90 ATPase
MATSKTTAKKNAATKTAATKTAATKTAATKTAATKTAAKKTAATKTATKKTAAKKTAATKTAAKKTAATKTAATKTAATKTATTKTAAKKPAATKTAATKTAAKKPAAKKTAATKTAATKTAAKKTAAKKTAPKNDVMPAGEMLTMEAEIPASPEVVYDAWLDAGQHGAMTGSTATSEPRVGGAFSAWDGYIHGAYLALFPKERLVMRWRTSEFAATDPDSQLDVLFSPHRVEGKPGTRLFLIHTQLPRGGASKYAAGWAEFYFAPMTAHFG